MAAGEHRLQDDVGKLQVYRDGGMVKERMMFYREQDDYCCGNSEAFRICILVKGNKYAWKALRRQIDTLVNSENAYCWHHLCVADGETVRDAFSRDLCLDVDIKGMLIEKYKSGEFYGSRILFYGDEVPEEYKRRKDVAGLEGRRVPAE